MSGSSKQSSTTTNTALQPYYGAYSTLLGQAQNTAGRPLQQYPAGQIVAPFNPEQTAGFNVAANTAGASGYAAASPYYGNANTAFGAATTPLWPETMQFSPTNLNQFESPYTSDVLQSTEAQFNLQNATQQSQLDAQAAASGAFGGDRQAVLQAQLAGQQQTAEAPVLAGIEQQGYQTALGEFNTQQQAQLGAEEANAWLNSQAGFGYGNLGTTVSNAAYQGVNALESAGGEQQQLAQELLNVPYEQFLQQQAYPFQTESWLAGIETGLGGSAGSTSTTNTTSSPSTGSQIIGGLESLAGLGGLMGSFGGGGGNPLDAYPSSFTPVGYDPLAANLSSYGALSSSVPTIRRGGGIRPGMRHRAPGGSLGLPGSGETEPGFAYPIASDVPNLDIDFIPGVPQMHGLQTAQSRTGGSAPSGGSTSSSGGKSNAGSSISSIVSDLAPLAMMAFAARRGGGIKGYDDGGATEEPEFGSGPQPPYPHIDYQPQANTEPSWTEGKEPWLALLNAGAETIASGNVGRGFQSGIKSYSDTMTAEQARRAEELKAENEDEYKQAEVEKGADALWETAHDAQARIKAESKQHFQMTPGTGTDPGSGQQVPGAYIFDTTTGEKPRFEPGVSISKGAQPTQILGPPGGQQTQGVSYNDFAKRSERVEDPSGNPTATPPGGASSAMGVNQMTDPTWLGLFKKTMPASTWQGLNDRQILAFRGDPATSERMTAAYAQDNAKLLQQGGKPITTATLEMAHNLGPAGALSVLNADPNAKMGDIIGAAAVKANPKIAAMTVGQYQKFITDRVGNDPVGAQAFDPSKILGTMGKHGEEFLPYIQDPMERQLVQDVGDGIANLDVATSRATMAGGSLNRSQLAMLAHQYNPMWSENMSTANATAARRFYIDNGNRIQSFNAVAAHLDLAQRYATALQNGDVKTLNYLKNVWGEQFNNPAPGNFQQLGAYLGDEIARSLIGSQNGETDRRILGAPFSAARTPQELNGAFNTARNFIGEQMRATQQRYKAIGGSEENYRAQLLPETAAMMDHVQAPQQRPNGVPGDAKWSPSTQQWWWQANGKWSHS